MLFILSTYCMSIKETVRKLWEKIQAEKCKKLIDGYKKCLEANTKG